MNLKDIILAADERRALERLSIRNRNLRTPDPTMNSLVELGLAQAIVDDIVDATLPPTLYMLTVEGARWLEHQRTVEREMRLTRILSIVATLVSLGSLAVAVIALLKA